MSRELQAQCSVDSRGFYEPVLFSWSLPFDHRFQLWDNTNVLLFDATVDVMAAPDHVLRVLRIV